MKRNVRKICALICVVAAILGCATSALAHSGRTDGSGGHKDNKNKSGLGSYHYHCGGYPAHLHTSGYCPYRDVFPTGVSVKAEKTTLGIGEKVSITATVKPSNACNTDVTWSSSDTSVVQVSNGVITAKGYGTATVYAESFNGKKGSVKITVKEITADKVTLTGVPESKDFYIGDSFQLGASISPSNVDNPKIVWSSSDTTVATVSGNGYVKLKAAGKVSISATASNGVAGKLTIEVKEKVVESVQIAEDHLDLYLGDEYKLASEVLPSDATYPELTWTVDDPSVLSVASDGTVTALGCGQTTITATSKNGISDSIVVSVSEIVAESISIAGSTTILLGDSICMEVKFVPENTTVQTIVWSVENEDILEVAPDGTITAKSVGTTVLHAQQKDVEASVVIEVLPIKVEEIQITSDAEDSLSKGDIVHFTAVVLPQNATYPNITWSTSDPEIATIDEHGVLTVLKSGTVTVIATADDGFYAEYELHISSPVGGVVVLAGAGAALYAAKKKKSKKANKKK